jgi:hypothetical protein
MTTEQLTRLLDGLREGEGSVKLGLAEKINFEVTLLKAVEASRARAIDSLIKELAAIAGEAGACGRRKKKGLIDRLEARLALLAPGAPRPAPPADDVGVARRDRRVGLPFGGGGPRRDARPAADRAAVPVVGDRLPPLDELVARVPAPVRGILDDLFRAKFTGVRRFAAVVMGLLTGALIAVHLVDPSRRARPHPAGLLFIPFLAYAAANLAWVTPVRWMGWFDWLNWAQMVAIFWIVLNAVESPESRRIPGRAPRGARRRCRRHGLLPALRGPAMDDARPAPARPVPRPGDRAVRDPEQPRGLLRAPHPAGGSGCLRAGKAGRLAHPMRGGALRVCGGIRPRDQPRRMARARRGVRPEAAPDAGDQHRPPDSGDAGRYLHGRRGRRPPL